MFRKVPVLTVLILVLSASVLAAQATLDERSTSRFPVKVESALTINAGTAGAYISADPSIVWKPGVFGAGLGAEMIFGASRFEVLLLPYLRLEAGWFYLSGGYVLPLEPVSATSLPGGFSVGAGIAPEPFEVGYGRLGFELLLDTSASLMRSTVDSTDDPEPLLLFLEAFVLSTRVGIGVTYSFML